MEYQKITNLLNKTNDQLLKYSAREWVQVNDVSNGMPYIKHLDKLNYTLVKETVTIPVAGSDAAIANNILKWCTIH